MILAGHPIVGQGWKGKGAQTVKVKSWINTIDKRQEAIAKERDKLDEAIAEMIGLRECCDRAWNNLQDARDALSELV